MPGIQACSNGGSPAALPEFGVGITYSSAIEPVLDAHADLVDYVEFEPQTTWLECASDDRRYRRVPEVVEHLRDLPFPKLVHSIGLPVGGTVDHDPDQVRLLREEIRDTGAPWVTDHLSFNSTDEFATGFFLPPRQTRAGVEVAVDSIRRLRDALGVPFAFETGVNYLASRTDEMADGAFVAEIAARADCGILLDLHNLYTNETNGRQSIDDFVAALDTERVWEVHLAGGFWKDGYWLDAHSGPVPDDLVDRSREIIAALPNVKAITFEIYPAFAASVGVDEVGRQLELIRGMWAGRASSVEPTPVREHVTALRAAEPHDSAEWEHELGSLVVGRDPSNDLGQALADDDGVALLRMLSLEFRASMISNNLRRTSRLLMLALGERVFRVFLAEYRKRTPPQVFAASEARAFGQFLRDLGVGVPQLAEVLDFELAVLETLIDNRTRIVTFDFDPLPMLLALGDGRLPDEHSKAGRYEIEITPDFAKTVDGAAATAATA